MTEIDEGKLMSTIIAGQDWQEVLTTIVMDDGMDPMNIDISRLADSFMTYLGRLKQFDFRIPGRFILVASILLRMKCDAMLEQDIKKEEIVGEEIPPLDISNAPQLLPPMMRKSTRSVTLSELVNALNSAFEFRERKETKKLTLMSRVENLIEPEEDIEDRILRIMGRIVARGGVMVFRDIVPRWERKEIVEAFMPLLYLVARGRIYCEQEEMFADISIRVMQA
ncbi:MAG TPA: segregation/condensation protein A [archaeon]|nr:segregation/condensation protein A [archaeon]